MQIVVVILAVNDLARSARFYDEAFGWHRAVDTPVYIEYEIGGTTRLGIYARESFAVNTGILPEGVVEPSITSTEVYLHVEDIQQSIERLRSAGARVLGELAPRTWGDEAAYFADPDGNVVVIARPSEAPGTSA